jgi:hypothetical protein
LIKIHKSQTKTVGQTPPDGRFACAHGANENEIHGGIHGMKGSIGSDFFSFLRLAHECSPRIPPLPAGGWRRR